jgi:hypothetical protein
VAVESFKKSSKTKIKCGCGFNISAIHFDKSCWLSIDYDFRDDVSHNPPRIL